MSRRELERLLAAFGAVSLAVDLAVALARWRLRAWDSGFSAGTRAARVLERLGGQPAERSEVA